MRGTVRISGNTRISTSATAQDTDSLPLIQSTNFTYKGSFKVPDGFNGTSQFAYGGTGWTYNAANNSLFVYGLPHDHNVAEVSIPSIDPSITTLGSLPTCSFLQNFAEVTDEQIYGVLTDFTPGAQSVSPGGLFVYNGNLILSAYIYYDGAHSGTLTHLRKSTTTLATSGNTVGPFQAGPFGTILTGDNSAGYIGGHMASIPTAWQSRFGGPVMSSLWGISTIANRSSEGPSAFVIDPSNLGIIDPLPAIPLVYYPVTHATLGTYGDAFLPYTSSDTWGGLVFPKNTRSILFFGRHSIGNWCYGEANSDETYEGQPVPGEPGVIYCFDPTVGTAKGPELYPYMYYVWAYDALDLLSVKNGTKLPWEITPYASWRMPLPAGWGYNSNIGGIAYDDVTGNIYIGKDRADASFNPVVDVYQLNLSSATDTTPPSQPTGLSATTISSSTVHLSWTASTDNSGIGYYKIYRDGTRIDGSLSNTFNDYNLTANTLYAYTVYAVDYAENVSTVSNSSSTRTSP